MSVSGAVDRGSKYLFKSIFIDSLREAMNVVRYDGNVITALIQFSGVALSRPGINKFFVLCRSCREVVGDTFGRTNHRTSEGGVHHESHHESHMWINQGMTV